MGSDKARLLIDGVTFTEKIASTLRHVTRRVSIVGKPFRDVNLDFVDDIYPGWGALGGLHAALSACRTTWAFVVACDLPFVTAELLTRLTELGTDFDAVVPIQADSIPQPLCAFYRIEPCFRLAHKLIQDGQRRPLDLLEKVKTRWVQFPEIEDLNHSSQFFVNINTPADYYEATRKAVGSQE